MRPIFEIGDLVVCDDDSEFQIGVVIDLHGLDQYNTGRSSYYDVCITTADGDEWWVFNHNLCRA